jgi:hypothetical protein
VRAGRAAQGELLAAGGGGGGHGAVDAGLDHGRDDALGAAAGREVRRLEARRSAAARPRRVDRRGPRQVQRSLAGADPAAGRGLQPHRHRVGLAGRANAPVNVEGGSGIALGRYLSRHATPSGKAGGHALPAQRVDVDTLERDASVGEAAAQGAVQLPVPAQQSQLQRHRGGRVFLRLADDVAAGPVHRPAGEVEPVAREVGLETDVPAAAADVAGGGDPAGQARDVEPRQVGQVHRGLDAQVGPQRAHASQAPAGVERGAEQPPAQVQDFDVEPRRDA